ncbi:MAG: GDP-mannose 4,6-dehydratase [Spirochaetales bacterium]|nr:GDP-mannose 4,6-dehydratase [Spirochaetales bacterium]
MTVIVTGAAGFIGSNLCEVLAEDHQVIGVDNFDSYYPRSVKEKNLYRLRSMENFELCEGDITDKRFIDEVCAKKPDLIIHLAARAGVRPSLEQPLSYVDTNITGTMVILEAMKNFGIPYMVFASSSSVYGNNKTVPFRETDFVDHPISPYAATKKACELLCHTYAHLHHMNIAALRFFTVYGRRQRPDLAIAKFTRLIDQGEEVPFYGDGSTERDYTYIDDIIDGITKCAAWIAQQKPGTYDVFNLGESQTISLTEMLSCIEDSLGKKAVKKMLPLQPGDVQRTFADISKAQETFGYRPSTSFKDGVTAYIDYYRNEIKDRS